MIGQKVYFGFTCSLPTIIWRLLHKWFKLSQFKATMMVWIIVNRLVLTFNFQFVIIAPIIKFQFKVHDDNFNTFSRSNINPPKTVPKIWVITRPLWRTENSSSRRESLREILRWRTTTSWVWKRMQIFKLKIQQHQVTSGQNLLNFIKLPKQFTIKYCMPH